MTVAHRLGVGLLAAVALGAGATPAVAGARTDADRARAAAQRFLDAYVTGDGRVVRTDQGGDTVGEGQSYALVLALVAGDDERFARVWRWTDEHLRRPDGLLAHRTDAAGAVIDQSAATDADVATAWALLRAGGAYVEAGRALAASILDHETRALPDGRLLPAAGDWAVGDPATLNPSYWVVPMIEDLATMTDDLRWVEVHASVHRALLELTQHGRTLPPDWARVDGDRVRPTPSPNGDVPDVRYSLDAQRTVVWLAAGDREARDLAARWWRMLERGQRGGALALGPDGRVQDATPHPVPLVAAAAAAHAAGAERKARDLLDAASDQDREHPTYYGAAWVALGRVLLTTDLLDGEGRPPA